MIEPASKRAVAFVDGQNLFHAAKDAFGHRFPNYDVGALAASVCQRMTWDLQQVRFYTGVPDSADDPRWHRFWTAKLAQMGREGVWTFCRPLRYRNHVIEVPGGGTLTRLAGSEKGVDIRIALDIARLARRWAYEAALVFSQDQDLSHVAEELREIAADQGRWIEIASASPWSVHRPPRLPRQAVGRSPASSAGSRRGPARTVDSDAAHQGDTSRGGIP